MEALLAANPYFSAGFGLIGVTAGLALLRKGVQHGITFAERRLLVSLEIPNRDHSYHWFLQWMGEYNARQAAGIAAAASTAAAAAAGGQSAAGAAAGSAPSAKARRGFGASLLRRLVLPKPHQLSVETSFVRHENGSSSTHFSLVPGTGRHYFEYNGAWFKVDRNRDRGMLDVKSGMPWETVTITTLSRDRAILEQILEEARQTALARDVGKMVIYTSYGHEWRQFGAPRRRRPFNSVVLDQNIAEIILHDVREFLSGGKWYHDRGVPYRRGYLLYGPPGSGKTSFIQALAGELEYNICILNLSERGLTDDRLAHLLNNVPMRSIILLEDIDAAFPSRTPKEEQDARTADKQRGYSSTLTFSGLLNALDGVAASEERIIFMTTNHLERLDSALVRPGRVDVRAYIGNATAEQARAMFLRFYDGQEQLADEFVAKLAAADALGRVSPAQLQGHFVVHRRNAARAVERAGVLIGPAVAGAGPGPDAGPDAPKARASE
ncbi:Complex III assembly protein translocase and chaperone [Polyrhizophydium stewartii]|uniref:Complex III assembly protein translocase and chaperone n=1 Tax=Polyrhizophydium stewartii TaxID=2732419 RepID=A0ABR4N882_9FUNG